MAGLIHPDSEAQTEYRGLDAIFEYCNQDGTLVRTNCGQCAAATFLTHYGKLARDLDHAGDIIADIEKHFPPDNVAGFFGTSRRRVVLICHAHGLKTDAIEGEESLKKRLAKHQPVIVMLGASAGKFCGFDLPGGHWMVAYGFDNDYLYLTNHGRMTWGEFRTGWDGLVPRLISMRRKGLVLRADKDG